MKNSLELIDERNQLEKQIENLIETGKKEERKLNDVENTEFENLTEQIKQIDLDIEKIDNENKRSIDQKVDKKINEKRMDNFRLIDVINKLGEKRELNEVEQEVLNAGKSELRTLASNGAIYLPLEKRDITATGAGLGIENVPEVKFSILEPLYANLTLTAAGAQVLTNLVGDVSIPTYAGSSVSWKGEIASATDGQGAWGEVILKPKRITSYINISKQFLLQDSNGAEAMLRNDIMTAISQKIESTILSNVAGTVNQPAGLFVGVSGTTTATYANITSLETILEDKNVKDYSFILNPKAKAILKSTKINEGRMVYDSNLVDGYKSFTTSNVYSKGVVVADFKDLVIGIWGMEITPDFVTLAGNGEVRLIVNAYVDAAFRRDSYSVINLA